MGLDPSSHGCAPRGLEPLTSNAVALQRKPVRKIAMHWEQVDRVAKAIPHGACSLVARHVCWAASQPVCACAGCGAPRKQSVLMKSFASNAVALRGKSARKIAMRWGQVDRVARAIPHGACPLVARRVSWVGNRTACACARPTLTKLATLVAFVQSKTMSTQDDGCPRHKSQRICQWDSRSESHGEWLRKTTEDHQKWGTARWFAPTKRKEIFMSMLEQWIIKDEYGVDVEVRGRVPISLAKPKDEPDSESEGEGADVDVARVLRLSPQKSPRISKNLISKKGSEQLMKKLQDLVEDDDALDAEIENRNLCFILIRQGLRQSRIPARMLDDNSAMVDDDKVLGSPARLMRRIHVLASQSEMGGRCGDNAREKWEKIQFPTSGVDKATGDAVHTWEARLVAFDEKVTELEELTLLYGAEYHLREMDKTSKLTNLRPSELRAAATGMRAQKTYLGKLAVLMEEAVEVDKENVKAGTTQEPALSGFVPTPHGGAKGGEFKKPCWNCSGVGHSMYKCPKLKSKSREEIKILVDAKKKKKGFSPRTKPAPKAAEPETEPAAVVGEEDSTKPAEPGLFCFLDARNMWVPAMAAPPDMTKYRYDAKAQDYVPAGEPMWTTLVTEEDWASDMSWEECFTCGKRWDGNAQHNCTPGPTGPSPQTGLPSM